MYTFAGDDSELHIIIMDEIDAICKSRGATKDGTWKKLLLFLNKLKWSIHRANSLRILIILVMVFCIQTWFFCHTKIHFCRFILNKLWAIYLMYTLTNLIENFENIWNFFMTLLWNYKIILFSGKFFAGLFSINNGPFILCIPWLTLLRIYENYFFGRNGRLGQHCESTSQQIRWGQNHQQHLR